MLTQKPLHPQKNLKANWQHKNVTNTSITQRLRTDMGRSDGVTIATQLVRLNRFTVFTSFKSIWKLLQIILWAFFPQNLVNIVSRMFLKESLAWYSVAIRRSEFRVVGLENSSSFSKSKIWPSDHRENYKSCAWPASTALCKSSLERCTLTNKALGASEGGDLMCKLPTEWPCYTPDPQG